MTCVSCYALLNDDELLYGAWCHACRPANQPSTIGETHGRRAHTTGG
jgi:hypothetical protein